MDKIGAASKPFAVRVEDLIEDGRKKGQKKAVNKPTDDEEKDIGTKAFLLTDMKFGLDLSSECPTLCFLESWSQTLSARG